MRRVVSPRHPDGSLLDSFQFAVSAFISRDCTVGSLELAVIHQANNSIKNINVVSNVTIDAISTGISVERKSSLRWVPMSPILYLRNEWLKRDFHDAVIISKCAWRHYHLKNSRVPKLIFFSWAHGYLHYHIFFRHLNLLGLMWLSFPWGGAGWSVRVV